MTARSFFPAALLAACAALAACASSPLCKAARRGDLAGLKDAAAESEKTRQDALYCAVDAGNMEGVRALLAAGAPITRFSMLRAQEQQPEILALLKQTQAQRDAEAQAKKAALEASGRAPDTIAPKEFAADSDVDRPRYARPERPADAALIVGVDAFGPHDAEAVRAHLRALGYPEARLLELTGPRATRLSVLKALGTRLPPLVSTGSAVAFYFSGRSMAGKNGKLYLLMSDSDPELLEDSALPLERVYSALAALGAGNAVAILETSSEAALPRPPAGLTVLAAADASRAGAYGEKRHGLFTYYLLRALEGGARTAQAALDAARPPVQEQARKDGVSQTPALLGPDAGL